MLNEYSINKLINLPEEFIIQEKIVRSSIKLQGSNDPSQLIFFTTEDPKNEENDY